PAHTRLLRTPLRNRRGAALGVLEEHRDDMPTIESDLTGAVGLDDRIGRIALDRHVDLVRRSAVDRAGDRDAVRRRDLTDPRHPAVPLIALAVLEGLSVMALANRRRRQGWNPSVVHEACSC